jgi:hypothetical protein
MEFNINGGDEMSYFAVYAQNTGQIQRVLSCPDEQIEWQCQSGENYLAVDDHLECMQGYINHTSQTVVPFPEQPDEGYVWDWASCDWSDQRTLAEVQARRWTAIKEQRDHLIGNGFSWNGLLLDSDEVSRQRIQQAIQLAALAEAENTPFTVTWTLADNSTTTFNAQDMIAIGFAMLAFVQTQFDHGTLLRNKINAATSIAEVEAIVWT